jgi:hypothetical protein
VAIEQFSNNPVTVLDGAISSTSRPVTFDVAPIAGFPAGPQFRIIIDSELLLVTAVAGNTWTASNVEGSAAATHADGAQVRHILTAGSLDAFVRKDSAGVVTVPAATAPSGSPASGGYLYVDTADGKLKFKGASGNITVIGTP